MQDIAVSFDCNLMGCRKRPVVLSSGGVYSVLQISNGEGTPLCWGGGMTSTAVALLATNFISIQC